MSRRTKSGSPASWKARRVEYQKRSGPVSNPGQPSPCTRAIRRLIKRGNAIVVKEVPVA